jgi:hypothetical protein
VVHAFSNDIHNEPVSGGNRRKNIIREIPLRRAVSSAAILRAHPIMKRKLLLLAALCSQTLSVSAGEWKPLWDGKTLDGWHITGKGSWKIEDGAIHGTQAQAEKEYGHLVTDSTFVDFSVRLKFKAVKGNSGLYFRIEEKGFSGITGFQAEIDENRDIGGAL